MWVFWDGVLWLFTSPLEAGSSTVSTLLWRRRKNNYFSMLHVVRWREQELKNHSWRHCISCKILHQSTITQSLLQINDSIQGYFSPLIPSLHVPSSSGLTFLSNLHPILADLFLTCTHKVVFFGFKFVYKMNHFILLEKYTQTYNYIGNNRLHYASPFISKLHKHVMNWA